MVNLLQHHPHLLRGAPALEEYLLKVSNLRARSLASRLPSKRSMILRAQRSPNDLVFYLEGAAALPADGSTVNVCVYTVPGGMDLILAGGWNTWSGTGFQNGQNLLAWQYIIGGGFIFNRGNVTFQNTASNGYQLVGSGGVLLYENRATHHPGHREHRSQRRAPGRTNRKSTRRMVRSAHLNPPCQTTPLWNSSTLSFRSAERRSSRRLCFL